MTAPDQARSEARQAAIEARLMGIESHLEELEALARTSPSAAAAANAPTEFDIDELDAWVREWLLPTFRRLPDSAGGHWCRRWWAHSEAVLRLAGLHDAWKKLSTDGGIGVSVWLREHLDPTLAVLLGDPGPFMTCKVSPSRHDPVEPLPSDPLPEGLAEEINQERIIDGHDS